MSNSGRVYDYLAGTDKVERENTSKHLLNTSPMKKELPDTGN